MVQSRTTHKRVSCASACILDPDFAIQIVQLALQMHPHIGHGLIVDGRSKRLQHQIYDIVCAKGAEAFVEFSCKQGLQMPAKCLAAFLRQLQRFHPHLPWAGSARNSPHRNPGRHQ